MYRYVPVHTKYPVLVPLVTIPDSDGPPPEPGPQSESGGCLWPAAGRHRSFKSTAANPLNYSQLSVSTPTPAQHTVTHPLTCAGAVLKFRAASEANSARRALTGPYPRSRRPSCTPHPLTTSQHSPIPHISTSGDPRHWQQPT